MKNLVIGASGQDGTLLIAQLLSLGQQVISLSQKQGPLIGFDQIIGDVNDHEIVDPIIETYKPDRVYYLAAHHKSSESQGLSFNLDLVQSIDTNARSFAFVLDSLSKWSPGSHTVYASSCRVFGRGNGDLLTEKAPYDPICAYGISKTTGMQIAKHYREQKGLKVSTAILFNHESELRSPAFLSKKIILAAMKARKDPSTKIEVLSLDDVADWGAARDYVRAMRLIANYNEGNDYIIASGHLHSVKEFAATAFNVVGLDWKNHVVCKPHNIGTRWQLRGSPEKLINKTGWQPIYTFEGMIEDIVHRTEFYETQKPTNFLPYI